MGITQLHAVKDMQFIVSNTLSLFTILPLAVVVICFASVANMMFNNKFLLMVGTISFEVYLVHAFTLNIIHDRIVEVVLFIVITCAGSVVFNKLITELMKWSRASSTE